MKCTKRQTFNGNADKALTFIAQTLVATGYELRERDANHLSAIGPGTSHRTGDRAGQGGRNALGNASKIDVLVDGSSIWAKAKLASFSLDMRIACRVLFISFIMCVLSFAASMAPSDRPYESGPHWDHLVMLAPVLGAPVFLIVRYLSRRRRAAAGVEDLLNSAISTAGGEGRVTP